MLWQNIATLKQSSIVSKVLLQQNVVVEYHNTIAENAIAEYHYNTIELYNNNNNNKKS